MQHSPLTVTAIVRHAGTVHRGRQVATRLPNGDVRTATYGEVFSRAAQLAHALRDRGVDGDVRVATLMWNNQEHVEAYCAVPAMGAVLHTLNPRLTPEQIGYIARHAEDRVILADASLLPVLAAVLPELPEVHTVVVAGDGDLSGLAGEGRNIYRWNDFLADRPIRFGWPELDEHTAAAMCYTSGTTGMPKGVVYSHRSTYLHSMSVCNRNVLDVGADDTVLPIVPMFHANAWGLVYAAMMAGAELLLPDRFVGADALVELITRHTPTVAAAVPTVWNDVLTRLDADPGADVSTLRLVGCGGSAVPAQLMRALQERHGISVIQLWGMTETSPLAAVARPAAGADARRHWELRATQGRPVCGVEARVVDEAGEPLPPGAGAPGELQVRGPWITGSYYRHDENGSGPAGWLATGDLAIIDADHFITVTDRIKDVIKSGGEWISSVALELAIAAHPDVLEAAVVGVPDDRWQERPLAAVVPRPGRRVDPTAVRHYLDGVVAKWWLPERWAIVEEIPKTSVGKYDKKTLRSRYRDGHLDVVHLGPDAPAVSGG